MANFFVFLFTISISVGAGAGATDIQFGQFFPRQSFFLNNLYASQRAVAKNLDYLDKYFEEGNVESAVKPRVALISTERFNKLVDLSPVFGVSIKY